jgi:hypothetical protein
MAHNRVDWSKQSPVITLHQRAREPSLSHSLERRMSFHVIDGSDRENGITSICGGHLTEVSKKDTFHWRWIEFCEIAREVIGIPYMESETNYNAKQSHFFKSCLALPNCVVSSNVRFCDLDDFWCYDSITALRFIMKLIQSLTHPILDFSFQYSWFLTHIFRVTP